MQYEVITQVVFPKAYREWIAEVYQEGAWGIEPEWVEKSFLKFDEERFAKHFKAKQMVQSAFEITPFTDSDEQVTAVTRDGEMSLTVIPYLSSDNGRRTLTGDPLDRLDEYSLQEVLALNGIGVPAGWRGYLEKMRNNFV